MNCRMALVAVVFLAVAAPAPASFPFSKKTKQPDPLKRLPELVAQVKSDPDERKRATAAEELRNFDAQQFPDLVPILIDVLKTDAKTSVRLEAAHSLSKLRPTTQEARQALEKAASGDASLRVRLQARTSLVFYHVSNAPPKKSEQQGPVLTNRPNDAPVVVKSAPGRPNSPPGRTLAPDRSTKEPPLANPRPQATPPSSPPQLVPTNPPQLQTPPPTEGPELFPTQK